jgi:hypothetical protein
MVSRLINLAPQFYQPNIVAYLIAAGSNIGWYIAALLRMPIGSSMSGSDSIRPFLARGTGKVFHAPLSHI